MAVGVLERMLTVLLLDERASSSLSRSRRTMAAPRSFASAFSTTPTPMLSPSPTSTIRSWRASSTSSGSTTRIPSSFSLESPSPFGPPGVIGPVPKLAELRELELVLELVLIPLMFDDVLLVDVALTADTLCWLCWCLRMDAEAGACAFSRPGADVVGMLTFKLNAEPLFLNVCDEADGGGDDGGCEDGADVGTGGGSALGGCAV